MKSSICTTLSLLRASGLDSTFGFAGRPTLAGASTVRPSDWQYFRKVGSDTLSSLPFSSMKPVSQISSIRAATTRAAATTAEFTALRSAFLRERSNAPATESKGNFAVTPHLLGHRARPVTNFTHRGEGDRPRGTSCALSLVLRFHRPYPSCWAHAVVIHCLESVPIGAGGSWLPLKRLQLVWLGLKPAGSNWSSGCLLTGNM